MSAHCSEQVPWVLVRRAAQPFAEPFFTFLRGRSMIASRAGEHQARVAVVETHQVGRLSARSADLDNLARPLRMAHDVAMHVQPVPRRLPPCVHLFRVRERRARVCRRG